MIMVLDVTGWGVTGRYHGLVDHGGRWLLDSLCSAMEE